MGMKEWFSDKEAQPVTKQQRKLTSPVAKAVPTEPRDPAEVQAAREAKQQQLRAQFARPTGSSPSVRPIEPPPRTRVAPKVNSQDATRANNKNRSVAPDAPDAVRPDIRAAVGEMGSKYGTTKELRKLQDRLWPGEDVIALLGGQYGKGQGLLVLTDQRILFLFEGMVSSSSEDFPFARITSVEFRSRAIVLGSIVIHASGNAAEISNVDGLRGRTFADKARRAISRGASAPRATVATQPPVPETKAREPVSDPVIILKQLAELHRDGILTDEEFSAKKSEVLRRL